jgi:DNA modification methylase
MAKKKSLVSAARSYTVMTVANARDVSAALVKDYNLEHAIKFGLPEVDDRYHIWRVPLLSALDKTIVGEVVIDARTSLVVQSKTTKKDLLEARLLRRPKRTRRRKTASESQYSASTLRNTVIYGDSATALLDVPAGSVDLVFTSPPYYNARVEYSDYVTYQEYLLTIRKVIQGCSHALAEGRFFVMNTAPVLIRRTSRNEASRRIAVPFDIHQIFIEEGFDFVDDIIWVKPEGAGWATGRGRRFAADRNPMQYKAVPVTEYVLVYRKKSDRLIDWHIRNMPKEIVDASKISDGYEKTNVWKIHPASHPGHPAVFPMSLATKVIEYYSFERDVVLDPFAGTGTVGAAAVRKNRRFLLVEKDPSYLEIIKTAVPAWLGNEAKQVMWINSDAPRYDDLLL